MVSSRSRCSTCQDMNFPPVITALANRSDAIRKVTPDRATAEPASGRIQLTSVKPHGRVVMFGIRPASGTHRVTRASGPSGRANGFSVG